MTTPDTVTEAVELLQAEGYQDEVLLDQGLVHCHACSEKHAV